MDGLNCVVPANQAAVIDRTLVDRLKQFIPRQMFKVAIQVVASASISPFRKDITTKCYRGDASRKKKLLKKQGEGKKRIKVVGKVAIPHQAFLAVMSNDPVKLVKGIDVR